jgi:hypothetical protein
MAGTLAGRRTSALPHSSRDALALSPFGFSEAGAATIGGVAENSPHRRSLPAPDAMGGSGFGVG